MTNRRYGQISRPPRIGFAGVLYHPMARGDSREEIFRFVAPMIASSVKEPFDHPDWIFETKLDGYRAVTVIDATGNARLWSRNRLPLEIERCFREAKCSFPITRKSRSPSSHLVSYCSSFCAIAKPVQIYQT